MEKDHKTFLDEKRSLSKKRERNIETLTKERDGLQDRLGAIQQGPHAKFEAKVSDHSDGVKQTDKICESMNFIDGRIKPFHGNQLNSFFSIELHSFFCSLFLCLQSTAIKSLSHA